MVYPAKNQDVVSTPSKMKDIAVTVREKILSYNTKILRLKGNNTDKKSQKQAPIKEDRQYYELQQLNTKNYDHYFKNNSRFYNYQRTRRISENSDNEQHYQINNERCDRCTIYSNNKQQSENAKKPSNRFNNKTNNNRHQYQTQRDPNNNTKSWGDKNTCACKQKMRSSSPSGPRVTKIETNAGFETKGEGLTIFELEGEDLEPEPVQPTYVQKPYQLMHPDWRWIPHVPLYGWTPHHEQNIRRLYDEIAENRISSMYYKSAEEYEESARLYRTLKKSNHFLKKPTVSTLEEVFALIKKTIQHDDRYTRPKRTPCVKYRPEDNGYDADVEETII